jgi:hypothetical protein
MSNVEVMYSVYFIKMIERSDSTLRHSIFDILRFCGSLFNFVKFHIRCQEVLDQPVGLTGRRRETC